jgi:hypothetical protein
MISKNAENGSLDGMPTSMNYLGSAPLIPTEGNPGSVASESIKAILLLNSQPGIIIESVPTATNAGQPGRHALPTVVAKSMPRLKAGLELPPPVRWGLNE